MLFTLSNSYVTWGESLRMPMCDILPRTLCLVHLVKVLTYRQAYNVRRTFTGYNIGDHSDVVEASPVGAAPTTS